jgi:hypothetical protein
MAGELGVGRKSGAAGLHEKAGGGRVTDARDGEEARGERPDQSRDLGTQRLSS